VTFAELSGHRVTRAALTVYAVGVWAADVALEDEGGGLDVSPFGVTLAIGGSSFVGTLVRAPSPHLGSVTVRIVGGGGGWRGQVEAKAYAAPSGVMLSVVAGDAAREAGERLRLDADRVVGSAFVRERCPAARVLNQLAPGGWYVGADGVTVIGERLATAIGSPFTLVDHLGGFGTYRVATETIGDWTPGRLFAARDGFVTVGSVMHTLEGGTLRTEVLA
jgi:hypothetical protein